MNSDATPLNELAQGIRELKPGLEWFESLSEREQPVDRPVWTPTRPYGCDVSRSTAARVCGPYTPGCSGIWRALWKRATASSTSAL